MKRMAVVAALAVVLHGCDLITGAKEDRLVGFIGYPDDMVIVSPESVTAGQAFVISVRTFGADGCWKRDRTDVALDGLTATITPYDVRRQGRGWDCAQAPVEIVHAATLTFDQVGVAQLTIQGRDGTAQRSVTVE